MNKATSTFVTPELLRTYLERSTKRGFTAPTNLRDARGLVDALAPKGTPLNGQPATDLERALIAERCLEQMITEHLGNHVLAMLTLLGLTRDSQRKTRAQRRELAGQQLNPQVKGETFRRKEAALLTELAVIIYRLVR